MSYYYDLIEKYEKILDEKPYSIKAVVSLARLYLKTKNIEKSISFYEALLDPMPRNIEIFKSIGVMYLAKNNKPQAMEYIKEALFLKENDPSLYEYAAEIDEIKSSECYSIAINIYKNKQISEIEALHCFMIALKLYKKSKYDLSFEYLNLASIGVGNTVEFKNLLGSVYYKTEEYDKAIEEYDKAINLVGYDDYIILINIASCYRKKHEFDEALKYLTLSLDNSNYKETVYYNIALVYADMNDKENVLLNLNHALELEPFHPQSRDLYLEITGEK